MQQLAYQLDPNAEEPRYIKGERYSIPPFEPPEFLLVLAPDGQRWIDKSNEARVRLARCKKSIRCKKHLRDIRRYRRKAFRLIRFVQ